MPFICCSSEAVAHYIIVGKVQIFSLGSELGSVAVGGILEVWLQVGAWKCDCRWTGLAASLGGTFRKGWVAPGWLILTVEHTALCYVQLYMLWICAYCTLRQV